MGRISSIVIVMVLAVTVGALPGQRTRRGFNNSGYDGGTVGGYGRESDEENASVSRETSKHGCSNEDEKSYRDSHELAYDRDNLDTIENHRGGRSFSKASASASAASSYLNQNQKNIIDI